VPRRRALPVPTNGSHLPVIVGAVIYVRVSTKEQTKNLSLPTQLRACEECCRRQGYEVLERFHEEGESAKSTDRSQLQNLLTFCRMNKGRVHPIDSPRAQACKASHLEVLLRERSARPGLQVPLETNRSPHIRELDKDVELPGSARGGVWTPASVMVC
jgi:Resolvase, N terminal domain